MVDGGDKNNIFKNFRKRLYAGTVPANKEYAASTVPANKIEESNDFSGG